MANISRQAFEALVAQTGLPLNADQIGMLHGAYPLLQAMLARVNAPMPREAEPALIFQPEVK